MDGKRIVLKAHGAVMKFPRVWKGNFSRVFEKICIGNPCRMKIDGEGPFTGDISRV